MGRFPSGLTDGYQSWLAQDNSFISKEPPQLLQPSVKKEDKGNQVTRPVGGGGGGCHRLRKQQTWAADSKRLELGS